MRSKAYKTRAGATQYRPVMTEAEYRTASNEHKGFCLACGAEAMNVEPDASRYKCESCSAIKVYGLEELLVMGLLVIE